MRHSRGRKRKKKKKPKTQTLFIYFQSCTKVLVQFHRRPVTQCEQLKDASARQLVQIKVGMSSPPTKTCIRRPSSPTPCYVINILLSSSLLLPPPSIFICGKAVAKTPQQVLPFSGMIKMFINTYPGQVRKRGVRPLLGTHAEVAGGQPPGPTCHGAARSFSPPENDSDTYSSSAARTSTASY